MRHDSVNQSDTDYGDWAAEPAFDLPPRLAGRAERRLAMRAADSWAAQRPPHALPGLDSIDLRPASEFAANSVLLDLRGGTVSVAFVGDAVAATFGIAPGALKSGPAGGLAGRLLDGCELLRLTAATVPVEGALGGTDCACLLTRGVLMPIAGDDGALGYAHGVFSWKQVLDAATSAALRRELARALHAADHFSARSDVFQPGAFQ